MSNQCCRCPARFARWPWIARFLRLTECDSEEHAPTEETDDE